jgi:hypothetical protein
MRQFVLAGLILLLAQVGAYAQTVSISSVQSQVTTMTTGKIYGNGTWFGPQGYTVAMVQLKIWPVDDGGTIYSYYGANDYELGTWTCHAMHCPALPRNTSYYVMAVLTGTRYNNLTLQYESFYAASDAQVVDIP